MTVSQVSFGSHEAVLDVKNLTVKYIGDTRSTTAVDNVSFSIGVGEVFGLAGESGCGKSTIANSIMRLLKDPAPRQFELPLFGNIAAGAPITAPENAQEWLRIDPDLFRPRAGS